MARGPARLENRLVEFRNRTKDLYRDDELAQIVNIASRNLLFHRRVRVTFVRKRWRFAHGKSSGWTWRLTLPGGHPLRVVVQVNTSRHVRRLASTASMTPAQKERSRKKGYLPKPEMRGVELPLFDTAHELYHAANVRFTFSVLRRRASETSADIHAIAILEEFRKAGGTLVADSVVGVEPAKTVAVEHPSI